MYLNITNHKFFTFKLIYISSQKLNPNLWLVPNFFTIQSLIFFKLISLFVIINYNLVS